MILDLTKKHPRLKRKHKASRTPRSWSTITGIVLHQTACGLSNKPKRWYKLGAHIGITHDGQIFLVNDLQVWMYHANYLNRFTIGIEIAGNYHGVEGKNRTLWEKGGGPHRLHPDQIVAAREACEWICAEAKRQGGRIRKILAHRQGIDDRDADPGQAIWQAVGLWAQDSLGLKNEPLYTRGSGLPIPESWDCRSTVNYFGKTTQRAVRWYQGIVGAAVDGDHGPETDRCLRAFQGRFGLTRDGVVGPITRAKLEKVGGRPPPVEGGVSW